MQKLALSSVVVVCLLGVSFPAMAFVDSNSTVPQTSTLRPPPRLVLRGVAGLVGNNFNEDTTILGNVALPKANRAFALRATDTLTQQVESYFKTLAGKNIDLRIRNQQGSAADESVMTFDQVVNNVPVVGAYAMAQIQNGQVHYARYLLIAPPQIATIPKIDDDAAQQAALADASKYAEAATLQSEAGELVIVYSNDAPILAWRIPVATVNPWASWNIFINAQDATFVVRQKASLDAVSGTVRGNIEPDCTGDPVSSQPLPFIQWNPNANAGPFGEFASTTNYGQAAVKLYSPYLKINNYNKADLIWQLNLKVGSVDNDLTVDGDLAQLDAFYHMNVVRSWMRDGLTQIQSASVRRALQWADSQLWANVNLPTGYQGMYCNAFYDPRDVTLNFFTAYNGGSYRCNNTARVSKVVYHEYGHGIHHHLAASYPEFDGQLSEGVGDFVSASITGSPDITGLTGCKSVLGGMLPRTCENKFTYCAGNSCDSSANDLDPHQAAPVLCGAFWDLGKLMAKRYGAAEGKAQTQQLFLKFLVLAGNMDSAYSALISVDDDADQNVLNGTTHSCEINKAFAAHFPDVRRNLMPCKH